MLKRLTYGLLIVLAIYLVVILFFVGNYKDKLWLHRCNSIEKFMEQRADYPNIEIDLVFREDGHFDVSHDIPVTFGLPLDSFFAHPANNGKMWLDLKNLTDTNCCAVLAELERLVVRYGVAKERLIIESSNYQQLSHLTEEGYYTSYYFPHGNPSKLSDAECTDALIDLKLVAETGNFKAVSFPYWWYNEISEALESTKHDLLTWFHRSTEYEFLLTGGMQMVNNDRLKVILIKSKGEFHR